MSKKKPSKKTRQKKTANPKAKLVTFAYGGLEARMVYCLLNEIREWPELVTDPLGMNTDIAWQTAWLPRTRSIAATDFLENTDPAQAGDVLLMIDRDMAWAPGDLKALTERAYETRGVVGGAYARRDFNIGLAPHINEAGVHYIGEDKLVTAEFVGTGFIAIHRDALQRLKLVLPRTSGDFIPFFINQLVSNPRDKRTINTKAYFPMFAEASGVLDPRSDDVTFSKYVEASGSPLHVYMKPVILHIGEYAFRPIDSQTPPVPNRPAKYIVSKPSDDPVFQGLPKDLSHYNKHQLNSIDRRMRLSDQNLAALWHNNRPKTLNDKNEWMGREDVGIESTYSQARVTMGNAEAIEEALGDMRDLKVYDMGSGIGTYALYLAERGCEVWCDEINPYLRNFIKFRAERLGVLDKLVFPAELEEQSEMARRFDLVVAMDVFPYLPNPEGALKMAAQLLKPNGKMVISAHTPPSDLHPMLTHLQNWDVVVQAHGFTHLDGDHPLLLSIPDDIIKLRMRAGFTMHVDRLSLTGQPQLFNGVLDPEQAEMMRSQVRPEDTVFDLGAHAGYYSLLLAPLTKKVVAVEPNPRMVVIMEENIRDNKMNNIVVEEAAVSDTEGEVPFNIRTTFTLTNHLDEEGNLEVRSTTLKKLIERHGKPRVIKIDVEGAEGLILGSADAEDLSETEWIFFEFHPSFLRRTSRMEDPFDLVDRLEELGFELVAPGSLVVLSKERFKENFTQLEQTNGIRLVNMFARRKR